MERFLLIGLGNPGKQYADTRHNLGIQTLHYWTNQMCKQKPHAIIKDWSLITKFNSEIASLKLFDKHITCLFPLTLMNKSGQAVSRFLHKRWSRLWSPVDTQHILIIHDDANLPLGDIKLKKEGSAGGHNGVRSIHESLDTKQIPRLLLGIGTSASLTTITPNFVLGHFSSEEKKSISQMLPQATKQITDFIHHPTSTT